MKSTTIFQRRFPRFAVFVMLVVLTFEVWAVRGQGPAITLRMPGFENAVFTPSHTILVPQEGIAALEIWLENAPANIRLSSIRVRLNEQSVSTFVSTNPLPSGVRTILGLDQTLNPALRISHTTENMLVFEAADQIGNTYKARFFLIADGSTSVPRIGAASHAAEPTGLVHKPAQHEVPSFRWDPDLPALTPDELINLQVTISDRQGLRRVGIEKNGKDLEEILLENGRPVRKAKGFRVSSKLPGTVLGDGNTLIISIPMELKKGVNTIVFRAENLVGLRASDDRTVQRTR